MNKIFLFLFLLLVSFVSIQGYTQEINEMDLYDLSLEELMNIPIASASKKSERVFEAPVSSYTITRAEIQKSGATTIMEALRLAPGVIVREQTNGNYDIHIRGFDNLLRTSQPFTKTNIATLVMIDDRPVFNNNIGGTQWETLPVDLVDVERIEIVRGPAAPLFGPNAVTGVINIITHRMAGKSARVQAQSALATDGTYLAALSAGRSFSSKWAAQISANTQHRNRFDNLYYHLPAQEFETAEQIFGADAQDRYPQVNRAMQRMGVNGFVEYTPTQAIKFELSAGAQASEAQKILLGASGTGSTGTYLTTNETSTGYLNLKSSIYGATVRVSYLGGTDALIRGASPSQYDYKITDILTEYAIKTEKTTFTPGFSYQRATYNDLDYLAEQNGIGFLAGEQTIDNFAPFMRMDVKPTQKWRVLAAVRADKFSSPDDWYMAYQLATTYEVSSRHVLRAVASKSNSGSFIGNNFLNVQGSPAQLGNTNLDLFTIRMAEVGYRSQITRGLQIDVDVFVQQAEDLSTTVVDFDGSAVFAQFRNIPLEATQRGVTLAMNYVRGDKFQFKPFATYQYTYANGVPLAYVTPAAQPFVGSPANWEDTLEGKHENTPGWVGGFFANLKPHAKWNFNVNGYFFSNHTQYDAHQVFNPALGQMNGKMLINAKVSYKLIPSLELFANARNAFNNTQREFYGADTTRGLYFLGLHFDLSK
jgi:iron complex outermembrane recepter protein